MDQEGGLLLKVVAAKSDYRKTSSVLDPPSLQQLWLRGRNVFLLEETRLGNGDPLGSSVRGLLPRARGDPKGGVGGSREPCSGQHAVGSAAGSLGRMGIEGLKRQKPRAAWVGMGTGTPDDVG